MPAPPRPRLKPAEEAAEELEMVEYDIFLEWGRTPIKVGVWEGRVVSLKGLVCFVPEGTSDKQLIALGRRFRTEFDGYDNINIDVFDNEAAASRFAEKRTVSPSHRVLNLSKDSKTGRDEILLFRGGNVRAIPWKE